MMKHELSAENMMKAIKNPMRAIDEVALEYTYRLPSTLLNSHHTIGTNVFEKEWDVLILLDTCRVDALEAVEDEYDFLTDVGSIWSVGGSSAEWIARTFDEDHLEEIRETAYLSANSHTEEILDNRWQNENRKHAAFRALRYIPTVGIEELGKVEYIFKYEPWGEDGPRGHKKGMTPPRYVTDRAIQVNREENFNRVILHYFQPHSPWVSNALKENRDLEKHEDDWWGYLAETGDVETVWESYLSDLKYVLDDVELLLDNMDAEKVAISADHGEAFGEFGILGHKNGSLHPNIRKVPWSITEAKDSGTYTPETDEPEASSTSREKLNKQLEALGYKT